MMPWISLCNLCVLCVSVVNDFFENQPQRLHREVVQVRTH